MALDRRRRFFVTMVVDDNHVSHLNGAGRSDKLHRMGNRYAVYESDPLWKVVDDALSDTVTFERRQQGTTLSDTW